MCTYRGKCSISPNEVSLTALGNNQPESRVFEPVGRVEAYVWMLVPPDCCVTAQVSTNVKLDNFTVYILTGKEIFLVMCRGFFSSR
jgi:hypothetical protein